MLNWNELLEPKAFGVQHCFHLVCFTELEEELELIKGEHFNDFKPEEQEQFVNSIVSIMAPFLRHHINLTKPGWTLDLKEGNSAPLRNDGGDKKRRVMDRELWVSLDQSNYRLLKKFHEGCNTFSMAMVLRSLLVLVLELIGLLGRDGFLLWVEEWLEKYEEREAPQFRANWKELEKHIKFFEAQNVKYIGLYSAWHHQIHFYHPPPDN